MAGTIRFDRLATGINATEMVDKLILVESRPKILEEAEQARLENQLAAWRETNTKLLAVKLAASDLSLLSTWNRHAVASSHEDVLTATAGIGAPPRDLRLSGGSARSIRRRGRSPWTTEPERTRPMASRADAPFPLSKTLAAIVQEETRACLSILEGTEAIEDALDPVDIEALEAAMATRGRDLRRLRELEERARELRGETFEPAAGLAGALELLQDLTARIRAADARAREANGAAAEGLRSGIRAVANGRQVLRGYRTPANPHPRFADRKG